MADKEKFPSIWRENDQGASSSVRGDDPIASPAQEYEEGQTVIIVKDSYIDQLIGQNIVVYNSTEGHIPSRDEFEDVGFRPLADSIFINVGLKLSKHSDVYLGLKRDENGDSFVAIKIMAINFVEDGIKMQEEAEAIKPLRCENIIRYIDYGYTKEIMRSAFLAMEICDQDTLHNYVEDIREKGRRFTRSDCISIAKQLTNALNVVHKAEIKHRDIKPSNVLFERGKKIVKLTDFSLQKPASNPRAVTAASNKRIGTDGWRAPESLLRDEYGSPSDIFALALTFYFTWSNGKHAFGDDVDLQNSNIKNNRNRNLSRIQFQQTGEEISLLEKMFQFKSGERPTAEDVFNETLIKTAKDRLENPEGEPFEVKTENPHVTEVDTEGENIVVFDRTSSLINAYNPSTRTWAYMQTIKEDIIGCDMTVALLNERIYTLLQNRRVYSIGYNGPNAHWKQHADLLCDHGAFPSAAVLGEYLYVVGGSQWGTETIKEGEVFYNDEWTRIKDMNTSRKVHSLVACEGCIYSIGGWDKEENVEGVLKEAATAKGEKYDPETQTWSPISRMNRVRYATAAVSCGNKIYVLGGWREGNRLTEAECYDANTNCWTRLANMHIRRSFFTAVAVRGKIYAVDGDDVAPQTIEEYDPETNTWKDIEKMENMQIWPKGALAVTLPKSERSPAPETDKELAHY